MKQRDQAYTKKTTKKKRLLFAAVDIGYRIEYYSRYINTHLKDQLEAESFSKYQLPSSHYRTHYTYTCPVDKRSKLYVYVYSACFFIYSLFRYDVFHFLSGETLLTRKLRRLELSVYKFLGKRIVMHFVGADLRSSDYLDWKEKNLASYLRGEDLPDKTKAWQKKLIAHTNRYAHAALVSTPDLLELLPGATYYPVVIDADKFMAELKDNPPMRANHKEITILHCPSNIRLKGTQQIHDSLKRIEALNRYPLRLVLPTRKLQPDGTPYALNRYELLGLMQEADIIIDQLLIGWYGIQSVEGLLAGKKVVCYIDKKLEKFLFPDCPIHKADMNTLDDVVIACIEDLLKNKQNNYAKTQYDWAMAHHTIENNHEALLKAWGISYNLAK